MLYVYVMCMCNVYVYVYVGVYRKLGKAIRNKCGIKIIHARSSSTRRRHKERRGGLIDVTRVRTAFRGRGFLSAAPLTTFAARDIVDGVCCCYG